MNKSVVIALLILFCCQSVELLAQQKYEQESRLKRAEVPAKALDLIDSLKLNTTIKWYLEKGLAKKSVEAKFKLNNKKYSIEFDSLGHFEDVEVITTWDEMPEKTTHGIAHFFDDECEKYAIQKIQVQYSGDPKVVKAAVNNLPALTEAQVRYEFVAKCRTPEGAQLVEYLFDADGKLVKQSVIILKPSSNLEF